MNKSVIVNKSSEQLKNVPEYLFSDSKFKSGMRVFFRENKGKKISFEQIGFCKKSEYVDCGRCKNVEWRPGHYNSQYTACKKGLSLFTSAFYYRTPVGEKKISLKEKALQLMRESQGSGNIEYTAVVGEVRKGVKLVETIDNSSEYPIQHWELEDDSGEWFMQDDSWQKYYNNQKYCYEIKSFQKIKPIPCEEFVSWRMRQGCIKGEGKEFNYVVVNGCDKRGCGNYDNEWCGYPDCKVDYLSKAPTRDTFVLERSFEVEDNE